MVKRARKPEPLTVKETELWPMADEGKVKLSVSFEGGDLELILHRHEAAVLVGSLRTHFGL